VRRAWLWGVGVHFKVPLLVERYLDGLTSEAENLVAQKILGQWRERLCVAGGGRNWREWLDSIAFA